MNKCPLKNEIKLNLGSGMRPKKGYINCDLYANADIKFDCNVFPYPFKDNSVDEIFAHAIFEHLDDVSLVLKECYRILKPKGILIIESFPHMSSVDRHEDITHKWACTTRTFRRLVKGEWKVLGMKYDPNFYTGETQWSSIKQEIKFGKNFQVWNYIIEPLANKFPDIYEQTGIKFIFPCRHIDVVLTK